VSLDGSGCATYKYEETILGSLAEPTTAMSFTRSLPERLGLKEQEALSEELSKAVPGALRTEDRGWLCCYHGELSYRLSGVEDSVTFWTPPLSTQRKDIHDTILGIARRWGIDQPIDMEQAIRVSEPDSKSPAMVSIETLLESPEKYDGHRVSVRGFIDRSFEASSLSVSIPAIISSGVWLSDRSVFAVDRDMERAEEGRMQVDGIFVAGNCGHHGAWKGQITRITRMVVDR
jgi:hypothetical protein